MLERDVEAYLKRAVKALGGRVRKVRWIGMVGAPDRLVLLPGGYRPFLIELKRPGKRPTRKQQRELDLLNEMGMLATWADRPALVDLAIQSALPPEAQR